MAKRGRKKGKHSPAKKRVRAEREVAIKATPESILKKMILVGRGNHPSQAENPASVMVARRIITPTEEHHLKDVARLWKFRNGNPAPSTIRDATGPSDHDSVAKTARYKDAHRVLGVTWCAVIEIAVYQEYPRWLLAEIGLVVGNKKDMERMALFTIGLQRLGRLWGVERR
jgi:hypothetical protein